MKGGNLFLYIIILILTFCGSISDIDNVRSNVFVTSKSLGLYNAIFDYEGIIYFYDHNEEEIIPISKEEKKKYSPAVSFDENKILYRFAMADTDWKMTIGIMDFNGNVLFQTIIESTFSNEIVKLEWLTDTVIGITGHVNPSTCEYFIYDISVKKEINRYAGYSFSPIPGTASIIYVENVPHGFADKAYHSYVFNKKVVYTSDIMGATLSEIVFNENLTKCAFIESYNKDEQSVQTVNIAKINLNESYFNVYDKIEIPPAISGILKIDTDDKIYIQNNDLTFGYNSSSRIWEEYSFISDTRDAATDKIKYSDFYYVVKKAGIELEKVNDLTWISTEIK